MKEYKISKGFGVFMYIIVSLLIALSIFLLLFPLFDKETSFSSYFIFAPLSIIVGIIGAGALNAVRSRLIIDADTIMYRSPFIIRNLKLSEIKGYKVVENTQSSESTIHIVPKSNTLKKIKVSSYFKKTAELLNWLEVNSTNLDSLDDREEKREILSNDEYGQAEHERINILKYAGKIKNYLPLIAILAVIFIYQNIHLFFSGEDFNPKEYFEDSHSSDYFVFYSNSDVGYIDAYSLFSNALVEHIKDQYFSPDITDPIDFYVLKDVGKMRRFLSMKLGIKPETDWGMYVPEYNALVTHEASGLGTFGHITMYPIIGENLNHAPYWAKTGIPSLFEKIYGYLENNELVIRYGYHNPWRLKELGDFSNASLPEIVNSSVSKDVSASEKRLVVKFIYQSGLFPQYIALLLSNSKGKYDTFIEAAFKKEMSVLEESWKEYLKNIENNMSEILETPPSQMFETKSDFQMATQRFKGL